MIDYTLSEHGGITVICGPDASEADVKLVLDPVENGNADAAFALGRGHIGLLDRLMVFATGILTGSRLSSMTHVCYAVKSEAFQKLNLTENGSGLTAELITKLTDRKYKCTEVQSETPHRHYQNLIHSAWSLLIHCPLTSYASVGLLSTIVEWVIFWLLDNLTGAGVAIATAVSFTLSTVFNWYLGRAWTFKAHAGSMRDVIPVCIVSAVGLGLSELIMLIFTAGMVLPNFLSKVLTTMLVFFWNYLARKKLIYRHN